MTMQMSEDVIGATINESDLLERAWPVRRYSRKEAINWVLVDDGSGVYTLHSKAGQLMLVQSGTVLESVQLTAAAVQVHGVVRDDTLLVAVRHQNTARKFKIRYESIQAARDSVAFLQVYFPIKNISKPQEHNPTPIGQMFNRLIQVNSADSLPNPDPLPSSFPLDETVMMCILDPTFPDLVAKVAAVLGRMNLM